MPRKNKGKRGNPKKTEEARPSQTEMESPMKNQVLSKNCSVCFNSYEGSERRRPRVLTCGHTFCSQCISDSFHQNKVTCPSCRSQYPITSCTDFPINFALESLVEDLKCGQTTATGIAIPPVDESRGMMISKKLRSWKLEGCSGVEDLSAKSKAVSFDLHQYNSQLEEWEEEHQTIVEENNRMIAIIHKESKRIKETIQEEDEQRQKLKIARDILSSASNAQEILPALEEVHICSEELEHWTEITKKYFPNVELITQSKEMRDRCKAKLLKSSPSREEETIVAASSASVSQCQDGEVNPKEEKNPPEGEEKEEEEEEGTGSSTNIQKKIQMALENASIRKIEQAVQTSLSLMHDQAVQTSITARLKVQDLVDMTPLVRQNLQLKRIYAVQEHKVNGGKRYARISLDENQRLCLHALGIPESPPPEEDSFFLQFDDVMSLVDISCRRTFLELGIEGRSLGRLLIRLSHDIDNSHYVLNYFLLCTGQMGQSYVNSNILGVWDKGHDSHEYVVMGDYEEKDGRGGKAVVEGVDWVREGVREIYKMPWVKGIVKGWNMEEATASQFMISTRDNPGGCLKVVFGMVEEGLKVLIEAISKHPNCKDIKVLDCGVLLSR